MPHQSSTNRYMKKINSHSLSPGRCYRRDTCDATHSANFHQIEGLYIDEEVSRRSKATLNHYMRTYGTKSRNTFRPHYFPLPNPVWRLILNMTNLDGSKSRAGLVDPNVFTVLDTIPAVPALHFVIGIERIARFFLALTISAICTKMTSAPKQFLLISGSHSKSFR